MRITSGDTSKYIYFVAVDATDYATRETGLSSFTVYRSRNGAAAAAMTTPTINETDVTNMPGVYELLLDEDMTITSNTDSEEMVFHITHAGMAPVTRTIELYRAKITVGETLTVGTGVASVDTIAISGDTAAADNLETMLDGTGGKALSLGELNITRTDANPNIILGGFGDGDGIAFTRSGAGDPFDTNFMAQLNTEIADAVLDEALSGHTTAGTLGKSISDIETDTNEIQTDWANGGRLDLILDARASQASVDTVDTNVDEILVDTVDIQSRLPAALVSGKMDSDVTAINSDTTAASNLSKSALGIVSGACEGTPTTTVIQTDLAEATDDHYIGRVVVFTSGAAAQQASDITDYTGSTGTITVTALTTAPAATDTFVIV